MDQKPLNPSFRKLSSRTVKDPVLRNISKRIEDFTGLSLQSAEKFQA